VPEALPKVLAPTPRAEVDESPSLSLLARPGDGSIATRNIAIICHGIFLMAPNDTISGRAPQDRLIRSLLRALRCIES
jgi:hypothetical protein